MIRDIDIINEVCSGTTIQTITFEEGLKKVAFHLRGQYTIRLAKTQADLIGDKYLTLDNVSRDLEFDVGEYSALSTIVLRLDTTTDPDTTVEVIFYY